MPKPRLADRWKVVRMCFEDDDLDTLVRFRVALPTPKQRRMAPTMVILKFEYPPKKDGMPRDADLERMAAFEDALEVAVEAPNLALPVACLTGNGRRTWRYFVDDPEPLLAALKPVLAGTMPRDPALLSYSLAASALLSLRERQSLLEAATVQDRLVMLRHLLRQEIRAMHAVPSLPATEVARTSWSPN